MIIKLKDVEKYDFSSFAGYRSYLDTQNGDVIMQAGDINHYGCVVYWEVIVRGMQPSEDAKYNAVDASHISRKQQVARFLRQYSDAEVETHTEANLDGILRDFANADVSDPDSNRSWETQQ